MPKLGKMKASNTKKKIKIIELFKNVFLNPKFKLGSLIQEKDLMQ